MIDTLKYFFPEKSHRLIAGLSIAFLLTYLISIPFKFGPSIFETYYLAANNLSNGLDPYAQYPGHNYFKYSPLFISLPMTLLNYFPVLIAAFIWQLGTVLFYVFGIIYLFEGLKNSDNQNFSPSNTFAFFLVMFTCLDLSANGIYLQSNTLIVAGMIWAWALYSRSHYLASALILAYVTNVKILPIILTLLLLLEGNKKFIIATIMFNGLFLILPAIIHPWETTKMLYLGWWEVLTLDKELVFGDQEIHHYLSLRPFLKVFFKIDFNQYYFPFGAFVGAIIGLIFFLKKKFYQSDLRQALVLSLTYILVFNTRTEGPSLVFLGPVYGIIFWGLYTNAIWTGYKKKIAWTLFIGSFFLISLSCSDLLKGTDIQTWIWETNFRAMGLISFFIVALISLFWNNLKRQLFD